jgi:predicted NBD/HSP70 family sugar kinase
VRAGALLSPVKKITLSDGYNQTVTTPAVPARRHRRLIVQRPLDGRHDGLILSLLRDHSTLSRSSISELTGLSPTTVTKAVAPLISAGYIEEIGTEGAARVGRPAIGMRLVPAAAVVCAVQIGVGSAQVALVDAAGHATEPCGFDFDPRQDAGQVLEKVAKAVRDQVADVGPESILAIGVGAPGVVEADHRTSSLAINLGWQDVPIAEILEQSTGLPTAAGHNVSAMALAENRFGRGPSSLAFVYVKTGVGLGLILRNEQFVGGHHGISELGHIHVMDDGEECACGARGCLETVASEPALIRQLAALQIAVAPGTSAIEALELQFPEHPGVPDVRRRLLSSLAAGIGSVANLFSPELVVLGGTLDEAPQSFLDSLARETRRQVFPLLRDSLRIERSAFGPCVGIVGAAAIAFEEFFYGARAAG